MIDALIQQLRDRDPAVRRQAIIALGKSKDINALRPLADVFRTDSDPELRELARKAGVYIRQQNPNAAPPSPPPSRGQTRPSSQSESSIRRRSLADLAAQVRGDDEASDIQATKKIEEYQQRRGYSPVTPLDADEGETPPPRFRDEGAGGSLLNRRRSHPSSDDVSDDSDMNFLSDYLNRTAGDDLSAYLDDEPVDPPPKRGRGSSLNRAKEWTLGSASAIVPMASDDDDEDEELEEARPVTLEDYGFVRGKEYNVTPEDKARARKNMDSALTFEERGQKDKALKTLALALKLDPNLINDGFFNSIASTITGKDGDEAIAVLISGEKRSQAMETSKKEQKTRRVEKHMEKVKEGTSQGLAFELIIYALIVTAFALLNIIVILQGLSNPDMTVALEEALEPSGLTLDEAREMAQSMNSVLTVILLSSAVGSVIGSVLGLVIQTGVIHLIARLFGGHSTYVYVLTSLAAFFNKWLPITFVISFVVGVLSVIAPLFSLCLIPVLLIFMIFVIFKFSMRISEAYNFGMPMGCLAFIISQIAMFALSAVLLMLLGTPASQVLDRMIQGM